ncbi:hypothetical protein DFH08DRAFT_1089732 [Mycena albidolilacea]|uniref:DUF6534 domain-containing protein n=1 Tax=Mycena albidolilacea TaxID=1033008 RepID=A0AAD6Z006_9AGAR|nr:hypothetical protein DFH08DRAFT_1089732 [Mycena albidolilacea]
MPAVDVLPALSTEDPLFGLIYYVLGGWFIGSSVVLLLEGILISQVRSLDIFFRDSASELHSQVSNYYSWYPEDSVAMKMAIAVLFLFTVLKTIQSFAITWINSVLYMRDPTGTVSLNKEWYQVVNIPLGAVIAAYVQTYYCYRLWKLSGKWWYVAPLVTVMLVGLVSAIVTGAVIAASGKSSNWFAVHVSCTFATDVLITGASTFFLVRARQKALSHTRKLISNLIKICCQTALPATTATLIELICSRIGGKSLKPQATNSIILVLLDTVPIINCMLYILNTRRSLRSADASAGLGNSNTNSHPSGSRSRTQWRSNAPVELSSLGGVHVRTQVETGETTSAVSLPSHKYTRLLLGMGDDLT